MCISLILSLILSLINVVLDEDFSQFQVAVPVPAGVTDGVILCAMPARLEIIDDDIVESDQSFSLNFAGSTIPGTAIFDNSSLDVVIMDDSDSENDNSTILIYTALANYYVTLLLTYTIRLSHSYQGWSINERVHSSRGHKWHSLFRNIRSDTTKF